MPSTFTILALDPQADAIDVFPNTGILAAIQLPGGPALTLFQIFINGNLAFTFTPPSTFSFPYPDFSGVFNTVGSYLSVDVQQRRFFLPGTTVTVELAVTRASLETYTFYFHVAENSQPLLDTTLQKTRVDQPFERTVALELLRLQLLSVLRPRLSSVSSVQLYYRVYYSQLRAIAPLFGLPPSILTEVQRVLPEDVGTLNHVIPAVLKFMPLFPAALQELNILGVDPSDIATLQTASTAPYPQDQVAAMCGAILFAARQLAQAEVVLPGP